MTAEQLREPATAKSAVAAIEPPVSGLYLHVDLDVLDCAVAHVNVYAAPGGLGGGELERVVAELCSGCPVRAVSLTAYDPAFDTREQVPPIALALLRTIGEIVARANS
jgi:arginase family enzyme